ncbi:hypothetical protein [Kitasatospora arboriphila]|uniref:Uncharacterized protein n=1 Tax=Kitasatospora arboriphila TaxID=258052 RepID=A0ABN1TRY4_9ACTN
MHRTRCAPAAVRGNPAAPVTVAPVTAAPVTAAGYGGGGSGAAATAGRPLPPVGAR